MVDVNIQLFVCHLIGANYEVNNQETISFNQPNSFKLVYFYYKFFDRGKEANIYAINPRRQLSQILSFLYFSSFIFKENHVFNEKVNPPQNVVIIEEMLDDIGIDDI